MIAMHGSHITIANSKLFQIKHNSRKLKNV